MKKRSPAQHGKPNTPSSASEAEPEPVIAVIEAMAMGKAVVTGNTGPGPQLVEDDISGTLCDPNDPDSIATKVINLLSDSQLRRQIGAHARLRAVNKFSVEALLRMNIEFYHRSVELRRMRMKE